MTRILVSIYCDDYKTTYFNLCYIMSMKINNINSKKKTYLQIIFILRMNQCENTAINNNMNSFNNN